MTKFNIDVSKLTRILNKYRIEYSRLSGQISGYVVNSLSGTNLLIVVSNIFHNIVEFKFKPMQQIVVQSLVNA